MTCAALVRPLAPSPRPSISGAVSVLTSVRKRCWSAVPTVVGVSAATSESAKIARIARAGAQLLRKPRCSLVQAEFINTRSPREKIVGRCANPVNSSRFRLFLVSSIFHGVLPLLHHPALVKPEPAPVDDNSDNRNLTQFSKRHF